MPHETSSPSGGPGSSLLGLSPTQAGEFGFAMSITGALTSAVGAYYSAQSQKYSLKSQALDLEYRSTMAAMNARVAEEDAQYELQAGNREIGRVGLAYKQIKSEEKVRQSAGNIQAGVGSAAEVQASINYAKETDQIAINSNAVRAANASRIRATSLMADSRMSGVGASIARRSARQISPELAAGTSLISGAGSVAREWSNNERYSSRYNQGY